jgi:hypothetical protein
MGKSPIPPLELAAKHTSAVLRELVDVGIMNASLINLRGDFII